MGSIQELKKKDEIKNEKRQEEIYNLKYQIQELMISEESTADEIEEWLDQLKESVRRFEEPMAVIQMLSTSGRRRGKSKIGKKKKKKRASLREWKKRRKLKRCVKSYRNKLGLREINQRKKRLNFQSW